MLHLIEGAFPFFALPFVISLICVPIAKRIGFALKVYAVENNRTVHHGKIVQMGGLAVFVAFMISMACFLKADSTINGILIGGSVVFLGGLLDDMINLSPLKKLLFEVAGALIAILVGGIGLTSITLPFGIEINMMPFSFLVSFIWIVGVTNAINLIDGLDGLSAGICFIVVCTIGFI
ncbi:MAG: MraY family glycosyltransferase, partial [Holdemania filiformis]